MQNTKDWASLLKVCVTDKVPPVDDYSEPHSRSVAEVAARAIVLHCMAAAGYGVDRQSVVEWLKDESLWEVVSPHEKVLLCSEDPSNAVMHLSGSTAMRIGMT